MSSPRRLVFHRIQEDIFERIAPVIHSTYLHTLFGGHCVQIANFDRVGHYDLHPTVVENRAFTAKSLNGAAEVLPGADGFHLNELPVRAPLFYEIADRGDASVL